MLTETTMSHQDMIKHTQDHVCAKCQGALVVAWGGYYDIDSYVLKCGRDPTHQGIEKPHKLEAHDIPGFNLFNRRRDKNMSTQMAKYQGAVALTKEDATEILKTIWPNAPQLEVWKAATICQQYGLNPLMKHLFLVCFNEGKQNESWVPILGIKATRLMARRKIRFSYLDDTPRVMTKEEQEHIFGAYEPEKLWVITKLRDGLGNEASGYGWYAKNATPYGSDKGNTVFNMASYRSERQAIDRLCPDTLPPDIEIMDDAFIDTPSGLVDTETGEIVTEAEVVSVTEVTKEKEEPEKASAVDSVWLDETLKIIHWTEKTALSWIKAQLKVEGTKLVDVCNELPADKLKKFIENITIMREAA